ncbi:cation-translocating P-type ATPase [Bacillus testis]|uniref:cation-translocating P-type ATPase n=1 Tax=Bacillus testis TaxID=1622072 RepID=UPI00067F08E9|nr:cation-translocating P-type ATPase [Bacillus testis]
MEMYRKTVSETVKELDSSLEGLQQEEVSHRQNAYGFNELEQQGKEPVWKLVLENFKDAMVIVLLIAAIVQFLLGQSVEAVIIVIVLLVNAIISVLQTKKAENSLNELRQMSAPTAKVVRNGMKQTIDARELVRGDIVHLDAGDFVPADGRLVESGSLKVNEGMLTGESEAVEKQTEPILEEVPLADRTNMVYSGSLAVHGRGVFIVTSTGAQSEIGKIAALLESAEAKQTPLQLKLEQFSKKLGLAIMALCVFIFIVKAIQVFISGHPADMKIALFNALMFSVAVAVAAIPEALSSIVTIVLASGMNKMAKQHAIIRKLPAVETLGSTTVICTDKTGTLTQNKMTVVDHYLLEHSNTPFLVAIGALCNDAHINEDGKELGDPTEVALLAYADRQVENAQTIRHDSPRLAELPFDSDRKMMSTLHKINGKNLMVVKGGPDVIFSRCTTILKGNREEKMTEEMLARLRMENEAYSGQALRVLAFAYREFPAEKSRLELKDEKELTFVGLIAMMDPPREEAAKSIRKAKRAGIKTVMITGDHKTTAEAIGRQIGLMDDEDRALSGQELDRLSDRELEEVLETVSVYARVSPENKIRIVQAWQKKKNIAAMTGDGVNDAPALQQADIGIAMGSGTDVAKDAAAMILTDDNFVSIVSAVEVGRTVFDNIKKSISYLFAGNLGAIFAILFALAFNWVNPFTALQLLFINLVNDSLPAIALGMEKAEPGIMDRKPRLLDEGIFAGGTMRIVLVRGGLIGSAVILSQWIGLGQSEEISVAMAFTTLILARTLQTFAARSNSQTIFRIGFFSNKYVLGAVFVCLCLYGLTVLPGIREIFAIPSSFGWREWGWAASLAAASVLLMEATKWIRPKNEGHL